MTSPTPKEEEKSNTPVAHERRVTLPRPPISNMTDFVVFAFVTIVTFTIISAVVGILLSVIFRPTADRTQIISILADITTSLISALVGFLAGKGQGRSEAHEEAMREKELDRQYERQSK